MNVKRQIRSFFPFLLVVFVSDLLTHASSLHSDPLKGNPILSDEMKRQLLTDVIRLVQKLRVRNQLNGLLIVAKDEDFRDGYLFHEMSNWTLTRFNHVPDRLNLTGNLMRVILSVIVHNLMQVIFIVARLYRIIDPSVEPQDCTKQKSPMINM